MFLNLSSSIPSEAAPRWHTTWGTWPAARSADEDRQLVGDKLATTAGEDERTVDEARAVLLVLLVDTGRGASDVAALWKHAVADGRAAVADRMAVVEGRRGTEKCSRNRLKIRRFLVFLCPERASSFCGDARMETPEKEGQAKTPKWRSWLRDVREQSWTETQQWVC